MVERVFSALLSDAALKKVKEPAEGTIEGLKETGQPVPREDEDKVGSVEV